MQQVIFSMHVDAHQLNHCLLSEYSLSTSLTTTFHGKIVRFIASLLLVDMKSCVIPVHMHTKLLEVAYYYQ